MNTFNVTVLESPEAVVIRLEGHAGFRSGELLEQPLAKIAAAKPGLVIFDIAKLQFVASLFLRHLVMFSRSMRAHAGRVQMAAAQPPVLDVLRSAVWSNSLSTFPIHRRSRRPRREPYRA